MTARVRFLTRRIAQAVFVVVGVVLLTFVIVRLVPGDPAVAVAGARASAEELARVRAQLGLDDNVFVQLWRYVSGLIRGDLGTSTHTQQPVATDLAKALPASLELSGFAILLAIPLGLLLGIAAASQYRRIADTLIRVVSVLFVSFPVFWLALVLQSVFATKLGWLPVAGEYDSSLDSTSPLTVYTNITLVDSLVTGNWPIFTNTLAHIILPALVIAAYPIGLIAQMTRATLSEQLDENHVIMECALGFGRREVLWRFALRPTLPPIVSVIALVFAYSLVNSFMVESIFNWPGIGSYTFAAIRALDTSAIAGVTLVVAILYVFLNLCVDLVQAILDPRVSVA